MRQITTLLYIKLFDIPPQVLQYGVDQGKMLVSSAQQGETSIGREITEMTSDEVKIAVIQCMSIVSQ